MATHREGVKPGFLTRFCLSLEPSASGEVQALAEEIKQLPGVDRVWLRERKAQLRIAYDGSQQDMEGILAVLDRRGVALKDSWWNRLRLSMQRQTDQNIKDNVKHEAHCCNKMPPGAGGRS